MTLQELQQLIRATFGAKDGRRGIAGTCMWFMEEALRGQHDAEAIGAEFADCLAWLATLANIANVDLEEAVRRKYGAGCPECRQIPCTCGAGEKP